MAWSVSMNYTNAPRGSAAVPNVLALSERWCFSENPYHSLVPMDLNVHPYSYINQDGCGGSGGRPPESIKFVDKVRGL